MVKNIRQTPYDKGYYKYHECVALKSKDYYRSYLWVTVNTPDCRGSDDIKVAAAWPHNGVVGLAYTVPREVDIDLSPLEKIVEELIPDYPKKDQILAHVYKVVEMSKQGVGPDDLSQNFLRTSLVMKW